LLNKALKIKFIIFNEVNATEPTTQTNTNKTINKNEYPQLKTKQK